MERKDDIFIFTEKEQELYAVPPFLSVASALDTADSFATVADKLIDNLPPVDDFEGKDVTFRRNKNEHRAKQLRFFANSVMGLCPVEVIDRMLEESFPNDAA